MLPREVFLHLLESERAFARFVAVVQAQRTQIAQARLRLPSNLTTDALVAYRLGEMFEPRTVFAGHRRLQLTQATLAGFLGLSRQRTNFALNNLRRLGEVELTYREIEVIDGARLRRRALAGHL